MQRKKQEQSEAAYGALWKNKFAGKNKAPFLTGELTLTEAFIENLICRYDRDGEVRLSMGGWKRIAESSEEPYIVLIPAGSAGMDDLLQIVSSASAFANSSNTRH